MAVAKKNEKTKEYSYVWEGKDKTGKTAQRRDALGGRGQRFPPICAARASMS